MRRKQLKDIFEKDIKRNNKIEKKICMIIIIFALFLSFAILYIDSSKVEYVKYAEKGNINYKVFLKDNQFFDNNYLEQNNQYISTLIKNIESNFKYNLSLEHDDITYKYSYRIIANVTVTDVKTKKDLYNKSEVLVPETDTKTNEKSVDINETITIDYNKYNNLMKNFINVYEVGNIESYLKVIMYVDVVGSCENFNNDAKNESTMTLTIPLTTNTMAIDIKNDLLNTDDNIMLCDGNKLNIVYLIISIISFITGVALVFRLITYIKNTRSAKTKYEVELKKILNNYRQYIQKVDNALKFEEYQKVQVSTFTDLLEIRDTIQAPILMFEHKTSTDFVIPNEKIIYVYTIKIEE